MSEAVIYNPETSRDQNDLEIARALTEAAEKFYQELDFSQGKDRFVATVPVEIYKADGSSSQHFLHILLLREVRLDNKGEQRYPWKNEVPKKFNWWELGIVITPSTMPNIDHITNDLTSFRVKSELAIRAWKIVGLVGDPELHVSGWIQTNRNQNTQGIASTLFQRGETVKDKVARQLANNLGYTQITTKIVDHSDTNWTSRQTEKLGRYTDITTESDDGNRFIKVEHV